MLTGMFENRHGMHSVGLLDRVCCVLVGHCFLNNAPPSPVCIVSLCSANHQAFKFKKVPLGHWPCPLFFKSVVSDSGAGRP